MLESVSRTRGAQGAAGRDANASQNAPLGAALGDDETLMFVHIPKCAGSSFRAVLKRWYGRDHISIDSHDPADLMQRLAGREAPPRAISGHFSFGIHEGTVAKPCYVSLVRDPVERMASLYKHARMTPEHSMHAAAASLDLAEFYDLTLDEPRARRWTVGVQCYFLARRRTFDATRPIIEANYRLLAPTEAFGQFIDETARLAGQAPDEAPERNRRPSPPELTEAIAALEPRIRQDHVEDQLLYERVRDAFGRGARG